jgi:TFIIF-interacting CTD phosphatase-like protein
MPHQMPSEDFTSNIRGQETRDHTYPDYPQPSNLNEAIMQEDTGNRALSHDIHESNIYNLMTSVAQNNFKLQNFLELKKENELFRRKVKIIKRHFKNS